MNRCITVCTLLAGLAMFGCSIALDFDALQEGEKDGGSTIPPECTVNSECNDNIDCTNDSCSNQKCLNLPDNTLCAYLEICDATQGCIPTDAECGAATDCDDQVACTVDACVLGQCTNTPDHTACQDPNPCIIDELCDPVRDCLPGQYKICEQSGEPCARTICDEQTPDGECVDELIDGADNDTDGYLDEECGGNDCDDLSANTHPNAQEFCDLKDNDCDEYKDLVIKIGPRRITETTVLSSPAIAFSGTEYAVVWSQSDSGNSGVYVQILKPDGSAGSAVTEFTSLGGVSSTGTQPHVIYGSDRFFVIWAATPQGQPQEIRLAEFTYDSTNLVVAFIGDPVTLSQPTLLSARLPKIAWDAQNTVWAAAWVGQIDSSNETVQFTSGAFSDDILDVNVEEQVVGSVWLSVLNTDTNNYLIAYSRNAAITPQQPESFETRIGRGVDAWVTVAGYPRIICPPSSYGCSGPIIATTADLNWSTGFNSLSDASSASDIWQITDQAAQPSVIIENNAVDQTIAGFAFDGTGLGLLYVHDVGSARALDFRALNSSLSNQAARFELISEGSFQFGHLIYAADRLAAVWTINHGDTLDELYFVAFNSCQD